MIMLANDIGVIIEAKDRRLKNDELDDVREELKN